MRPIETRSSILTERHTKMDAKVTGDLLQIGSNTFKDLTYNKEALRDQQYWNNVTEKRIRLKKTASSNSKQEHDIKYISW